MIVRANPKEKPSQINARHNLLIVLGRMDA